MDTRRSFLKKSLLLSGATGAYAMLPESIRRAASILPDAGTSYLDAEHVVILMQENRSFDHCFGTLGGVRGFNDPRTIRLPSGNKVWLQGNENGQTYVPFRFDIKNTRATWMGSTPHTRPSQVDCWNEGKYDKWLSAKKVKGRENIPMTLGFYNRQDIPFHYALADAFTVCDQHFSSGMTCTNPNRLFFWTGTCRDSPGKDAEVYIRNLEGEWRWAALPFDTFPERLQDNGISWKYYQNDIFCGGGFRGEERSWLSNFGCNPLEWFKSYNVRYSARHLQGLEAQVKGLPAAIDALSRQLQGASGTDRQKLTREIAKKREVLQAARAELQHYTRENFDKLSDQEKQLYERAFTTNVNDPDYHRLSSLSYDDQGTARTLSLPKGDIFYQFRKDVETGNLPTVSWLASPENFSDHPSVPWYGAYYLSEVLDILTRNPEVWKKTIFIVTYDENDGYFDHVPPYAAPDPKRPETGGCSGGITTEEEYIHLEDELRKGLSRKEARGGPIGLGYRVPMIIASPWSRGGKVCSEIFDHTSTLQFLEAFCNRKFGKDIRERNISEWRRTVTGDLTSAFSKFDGNPEPALPFLQKKPFIETIYNAKFKSLPSGFHPLSAAEIRKVNEGDDAGQIMPRQEKGMRRSYALPYELYAEAGLSRSRDKVQLRMKAGDSVFGKTSSGSPFNVYLYDHYHGSSREADPMHYACYAVRPGDMLDESWDLSQFVDGRYHLDVHGPNGFFRSCRGSGDDPKLEVSCHYESRAAAPGKLTGNVVLVLANASSEAYRVVIKDEGYGRRDIIRTIAAGRTDERVSCALDKSYRWYDLSVKIVGSDGFERRYAGRVETGAEGVTDPLLAG